MTSTELEAAEQALARAREAEERAAEAREAAEALVSEAKDRAKRWYLDAEPEAGSVVQITTVFPGRVIGGHYTYIAYRPSGSDDWYLTGRSGRLTWEDIFYRMKAADITIEKLRFV